MATFTKVAFIPTNLIIFDINDVILTHEQAYAVHGNQTVAAIFNGNTVMIYGA